jgi:23S rRNA (uracil1939-C5)-methyltransferase
MRARFHVRHASAGFYREGTHEMCAAGQTGQLADASVAAVEALAARLAGAGLDAAGIELSENISGDMRVAAVELVRSPANSIEHALDGIVQELALSGCTARWPGGGPVTAGVPVVIDPLAELTAGRAAAGSLSRHAESFFQANRFLVATLVTGVLDAVAAEGEVLDLYAGVGLFSVSLAGAGRSGITAVEGDRVSGRDLRANAAAFGSSVRVVNRSVEDFLAVRRRKEATAIVDPPRTGLSREAMQGLVASAPARIIYVSCDPATMARDARRLVDANYTLASIRAFDLFPNTPHVEVLGVFARA